LPPRGQSASPRSGYDTIPTVPLREPEIPKRAPVVPPPYNPSPPPKPNRNQLIAAEDHEDDEVPPVIPQKSRTLSQQTQKTTVIGSTSSLEPTQEDNEVRSSFNMKPVNRKP